MHAPKEPIDRLRASGRASSSQPGGRSQKTAQLGACKFWLGSAPAFAQISRATDQFDEAQFADWMKQASKLPGELM
jgi:hypothetical protein